MSGGPESDVPLLEQAEVMEGATLRLLVRRFLALHDLSLEAFRASSAVAVVASALRLGRNEFGFDHVSGALFDSGGVVVVAVPEDSDEQPLAEKYSWADVPWALLLKGELSAPTIVLVRENMELYSGKDLSGAGQSIAVSLWGEDGLMGWFILGRLGIRGPLEPIDVEVARLLGETVSSALASVREQTRTQEEVERLAQADTVTGVPQRREFEDRLRAEWMRLSREGGGLAVVLVDIDGFQSYSAHYGHAKGDVLLKRVAQCLRSNVWRPADFIARHGGDEFAALLPNTTLDGAEAIADRLRRAVSAMHIEHARSDYGRFVSISLGVASRNPGTGQVETLMSEAEQALYLAKVEGGDRVIVFDQLGN